ADQPPQAHAANVLHRNVVDTTDVAGFIGLRQMRMADSWGQVHFADEASEHSIFLAGSLGRQDFERDQSLPPLRFSCVVGEINGAHSAFAQRRENMKWA